MQLLSVISLLLLALSAQPQQTESAKILVTLPFPGRSQYIFVETYLKALAARGHQLTVINTFKNKEWPNIRFIQAPKIHEYFDEMLADMNMPTLWQQLNKFSEMINKVMVCILEDNGVQNLLKSGETFDLVLAEMLQMEPLFGFAQHFNATLIGFSSYGNDYHIDEIMGNISPISSNPLVTSPRTDRMNFYERLLNHYELWVESVHRKLVHLPLMEQTYAKYFPHAKKTIAEVLDSFSLMLLGQHFTLSYPRTYLPNMIEVGGMHISHKPKPLPEDIKEFIETATDGVIYFSLGSNVKSKDLPKETLQTLLNVFGGLKQRILWKFEDDQLPGKPSNVFISKWFPQPDILAHSNVKLFITHGGLLSTIESIYFGKPVLGLPVFYDQFMNVERARKLGFGLGLDLQNLQQAELAKTIHILLTTPCYAKVSSDMSERYRDQPEAALERAVWWTEYIIRHKGAPHLRAASRDLNFIQHHSLDTLAVLLGAPLLILVLIAKVTCKLCRRFGPCKQKQKANKKKNE